MADAVSTNVTNMCSQCGKTFRHRRNLHTHEKSHVGTFPFTCCDRGFTSRRDLDRHRCREHDSTKKYVCLTCSKTFSTISDLKAHERRENNRRAFSCDICSHHAATRPELTEHMRSHADNRSLACPQCGAMYKHRSSLSRHIRQRHGSD